MKVDEQAQALGSKRPHPNGSESLQPTLKVQARTEPNSAAPVRALVPAVTNPGPSLAASAPGAAGVASASGAATATAARRRVVSNGAATGGARSKPPRKPPVNEPDVLKILEVTNDGDPANMEMLIHLKVRKRG